MSKLNKHYRVFVYVASYTCKVIYCRHNIMTEIWYIQNIVRHTIQFRPDISSDIHPVLARFQKNGIRYISNKHLCHLSPEKVEEKTEAESVNQI